MQTDDLFDQLIENHRNEIVGYLTRMLGDVQDAEDAYQDALLRAYRAHKRLRPDSNVRAWMYKIATRVALNALKRRRRERSRITDMDLDTLSADSTLTLEQREQLRSVARAVEALPPKQRAALMQRQFQGLSYAEVAQSLGGSEAAARANVYQALRKLKLALKDE
jgi:RNA polymerase sigma-70 factor (ECF subfamily)